MSHTPCVSMLFSSMTYRPSSSAMRYRQLAFG